MGTPDTTTQTGHSNAKRFEVPRVILEDHYARWSYFRPILSKHDTSDNVHLAEETRSSQFARITQGVWGFKRNTGRIKSTTPEDYRIVRQHVAFTLLVPGGKATRANAAVKDLTQAGFFEPQNSNWWTSKKSVADAAQLISSNVRFYIGKAGYLAEALEAFEDIPLPDSLDEAGIAAVHKWVLSIRGFGPKAAAHLMRNLGFFSMTFAYPIIDVHIKKALNAFSMDADNYHKASVAFVKLAELVSLPPVLLDAYIWCAYSGNWEPDAADFTNFEV